MGRKNKKTLSKNKAESVEQLKSQSSEFQLDLGALDGYDLPSVDDKEDVHGQPQSKKFKQSKPEVLGIDYREREEKRLEELLFGELFKKSEHEPQVKKGTDIKSLESKKSKKKLKKQISIKESREAKDALPEDVYGKNLGLSSTAKRQAAWVDEDDEDLKCKNVQFQKEKGLVGEKAGSETVYKQVLEKRFASIHGQITPKWAQLQNKDKKKAQQEDSDNEEDEQDLTKTATNLLRKDSILLPKEIIKYSRMSDINKETRAEGCLIKSVEFHKKQSVALVGGDSGVLTLFQIGGSTNAKIQSITFKQYPIHKARFSANGEEVIVSSNVTGNIQVHNLANGRNTIIPHNKQMEQGSYKNFVLSPDGKLIAFQGQFGYIHLMSARSKEWITSLKMNGNVHALTFNADGTRLYSHGEFGEVYVWDMNGRVCVHKFLDDGCITGTSVAISPTQQYLACGSSSGIVNLYNTNQLENNSLPKPDKVIQNLVTKISGINFHPSSEIVSMFSSEKENAVRLAHFPSMTIFKNFPIQNKSSARVCTMDFSPSGGYMAAGFNNGSALLYRLNHYDQY